MFLDAVQKRNRCSTFGISPHSLWRIKVFSDHSESIKEAKKAENILLKQAFGSGRMAACHMISIRYNVHQKENLLDGVKIVTVRSSHQRGFYSLSIFTCF